LLALLGRPRPAGWGQAKNACKSGTFPLTFETPLARLSVKLREKLRWNAGYQYYRYGEEFLPAQNYRAHTGYTSLLWSF